MKKPLILIFLIYLSVVFVPADAYAIWVWTPETNKWTNPKYAVKETPAEQLDYALGFFKEKDFDTATTEFRKLIKSYPRAREAADAQYYIGKIFEEEGSYYHAFKEYQEVIDKYPFSERSAQVVKLQYEIGERVLNGEGVRKFIGTFTINDYDVVEIFRAIIKNAPYGEYAAPSQYKIGLYLMEKRLYQEARDEFEKVVNDYPESEWAKAAKYQIALTDANRSTAAEYDQRVTKAAVEEFKEFVETYPDAELTEDAKSKVAELREKEAENTFIIAQFYEKQRNYKAAKIYYQTVVDQYGNSSFTSKALQKIRTVSSKIKE